jgi:hypothetical protein
VSAKTSNLHDQITLKDSECAGNYANSKITMDIYTQALSPAKRQAQSRVASMILPEKGAVSTASGGR